jgi:diaminopropionate ammonia-lyase
VAKELDVKHVLLKNESSRFGLPAFKILGASWAICSILADRWKIDKSNLSISALYDAARQFPNFTIVTATDGKIGRLFTFVCR